MSSLTLLESRPYLTRMLTTLLYSLLALDQTLANLAGQYGPWLYALLFVVIFAETGLVVFPFLPGDSILFIAGTVVATAELNVHLLVALLIAAAILGDSVNYSIGHYIGPKVFDRPDSRWFKQDAPAPHAGVLRQVRRRHDHHRPLRADHPHVRPVPGRRGRDDLPQIPVVQRDRRGAVDRCRWSMPATCSATSRGSRRTCR